MRHRTKAWPLKAYRSSQIAHGPTYLYCPDWAGQSVKGGRERQVDGRGGGGGEGGGEEGGGSLQSTGEWAGLAALAVRR